MRLPVPIRGAYPHANRHQFGYTGAISIKGDCSSSHPTEIVKNRTYHPNKRNWGIFSGNIHAVSLQSGDQGNRSSYFRLKLRKAPFKAALIGAA